MFMTQDTWSASVHDCITESFSASPQLHVAIYMQVVQLTKHASHFGEQAQS